MSGPKDYSPAPQYSMEVFNGKLNQVFQLQSRLKMLCSLIEDLHVLDSELNIQIDCRKELSKIRNHIYIELRAYVLDYKGTFGNDTYNRINGEIDLKTTELLKTINECELIKSDFERKKEDYKSFLSYLVFYDNLIISLDEFRSRIIQYFKSNIESVASEIFKEAEKKILDAKFERQKADFDFGFRSSIESQKKLLIDHVIQKEETINNIRAEISDRIIDKFKAIGAKIKLTQKLDSRATDESKSVSEKIKSMIRNCDEPAMRRKYMEEFEKLSDSETLTDIYFFKELHDSILETEKTRRVKMEINCLLAELNTISFHPHTGTKRQTLITFCLRLLNSPTITKNESDDIKMKFGQLKIQSNKLFEEDEIRNKERLFLKSQLILCLENQGYEVMDDLEVIDFEKENDFLLKIKGQENYLNLKFKDDGSMRYIFQIPEDKEKLSTDQINKKLHEMKVTCSEFKSALKDLAFMGLKVNIRSEKPIQIDTIVTLTNRGKDKLKTKSTTRQQKQQLRKKYLQL